MVHRGHVDQEPPGQRDVTSNARSFLADRFFGDLDQNFLAFFEQITDQWNRRILTAPETASAATAALAVARTTLAIIAGTGSLGALRITRSPRRSANFHSCVNGAVAASLSVECGFRLRLSLFEFQFLAVVFAFGRSWFGSVHIAGIGERRHVNFGNDVAGLAVQLRRLTGRMGFFLKLFITFVGGGFVMDRVRFFFVDGFFFHGARVCEHWSLLFARGRRRLISVFASRSGIVVFFFFPFPARLDVRAP